MKKKILSILITILAVCIVMFTMMACTSKDEFKINFVVDGEVYAVVNTNGEEIIKMPQDPSKEDYNFDGWFWDKDIWEKPFTANSFLDAPLSSNMSVYAKFSLIHVCAFTEEVANNDYIATNATCEDRATYYYSCSCGEKGTETFEIGEPLGHSYTNYVYNDDATCLEDGTETSICDRCPIQDIRKKLYTQLEHNHNAIWVANGSHHWRECVCGDKIDLLEHSFDVNNSCSICQKSITTLAIASYDISKNSNNSIIEYVLQTADLYYNVYVIGYGETKDYNSSTSPLFKNNYASRIKNLFIDERITSLGNSIFYGCTSVKEIIIPENIQYIGNEAFKNCSSLTNIIVPNSVVRIGLAAFNGCSSLNSISLPFVGGSAYANSDSSTTLFGYIFGTDDFTNSSESLQTADNGKRYYIPRNLKAVHISAGRVGKEAFRGCQFKTITLTDNITYIGEMAFYNCPYLESFTIPQGITTIEADTFNSCTSLTSIIIPSSVESIGPKAFRGCGFKSIIIPENVKSIGHQAFSWCRELLSIKLPNTLVEISEYAFDECKLIETVAAPSFVFPIIPKLKLKTAIVTCGESLSGFSGAQNLENVTLCDTIVSVDNDVFSECNLLRYNTKNNMNYLGSESNPYLVAMCPTSTSLINLVVDENCKIIYNQCFNYCTNLKSSIIPENIIEIAMGTFKGCNSLESITLPFVWATKDGTFNAHFGYIFGASSYLYNDDYVPTSLQEVIITGGTIIGDLAFYGCRSLTSVVLGNSVKSIGSSAFYGCRSLTSVVLGNSIEGIGEYAFRYCYKLVEVVNKSTHIKVEKGSTSNGYVGYYSLVVYIIDSGITESQLVNDNGYIICADGNEKIVVGYNGQATDLVLPNYITKINNYAFHNCTSLTSVVIGDSVTSIGEYAFSGCSSLESIILPFVGAKAGVTSSDKYQYPFGYIFGTSSYMGSYSAGQYYYGSSTSSTTYTTYYIPKSLKSVTITGGNILYGAFHNCTSLTSVVIGDSVTSIGERAFSGCSSLTSIKYRGTASQWQAITKGFGWNSSTGNFTITYNYKGE